MPEPLRYSRRALLQSTGGLAAYALGAPFSATALAQDAKDAPNGAAHHRFALGTHEIFVLSDGHMIVPSAMLAANVPPADVAAFLAARALDQQRVRFHINVALVKTGSDYVLIDAGAGGTWEPRAGRLVDSLEAAGVTPEQIGTVVLTHGHPDHLWGLIDDLDGSLRFPRARHLVAAREIEFWTSNETARLSGPIEGMAAGARRVFKAIADRTTRIKPGEEIASGITAIDTAGHTPGHISLVVTSGTQTLLVTADAIQNAHIAFAHPDWQPRADLDGEQAARNRRRLLDMAATDRMRVLSYHIPFPGLGRVERAGPAFRWVSEG